MRYSELLQNITQEYNLEVVESWDGDYDILIEGPVPQGLRRSIENYGFRTYLQRGPVSFLRELHIHSPRRKETGWDNRGWDEEVDE